MAWIGALVGGAISLLGDSESGGGAGSSSGSKEPWSMATPWLLQNLAQGQTLQNRYTAQPISSRQRAALDNQYAQSDYMRGLIPGLLGQLQSQPVGFDKNNRSARPKAWDWNALADGLGQRRIADVMEPAAAPAPAKEFRQQTLGYTPQQQALIDSGRNPFLMGDTQYVVQPGAETNGGYGAYRYGDTPAAGTPAYRDMMEFFLMGGNDPGDLAPGGLGIKRRAATPWLLGNSGDSVGGSAAADGSGGGGPGAF